MTRSEQSFLQKYGAWAVVAGAGEGLGAAFAHDLARRGMNVLLIARRKHQIEDVAAQIRSTFNVETRCLDRDLGEAETLIEVERELREREVGILVYNAAYSPFGSFLDMEVGEIEQTVAVNVVGPLAFTRALAPAMRKRNRGGVVLMSSLAGLQGTPGLVPYSSSKAFNIVLGEGLWRELRESGIDVVTCIAGAVHTPGYTRFSNRDTLGIQSPKMVARQTLDALHKGPRFVPGITNRFYAQLLSRLLPRNVAIAMLANASKRTD